MREPTPSPAVEIETVKAIYAAINRNDIPAAIKFFDRGRRGSSRRIIRVPGRIADMRKWRQTLRTGATHGPRKHASLNDSLSPATRLFSSFMVESD